MTNSCSTKAADVKVELVARLCDFHARLSSCFEGKTGERPPSRPWRYEPQFADLDTLLDAAVALGRTSAALEVGDTRQDTEQGSGASADADQALAVPATPANAVGGPAGFDPSRLREFADYCEAVAPEFAPVVLRGAFDGIHGEKPQRILGGSDALTEWLARFSPFYQFLNDGAWLSAARSLLDVRALWAVGDMEDGPFARICWPMPCGGYLGGYVEGHARTAALSLCAAALRGNAIAMETAKPPRREAGVARKGDSAGPKDIAHDQG